MNSFKLPSPDSSGDDENKRSQSSGSPDGNTLPSFEDLLSEFENDGWNESRAATKADKAHPADSKDIQQMESPESTSLDDEAFSRVEDDDGITAEQDILQDAEHNSLLDDKVELNEVSLSEPQVSSSEHDQAHSSELSEKDSADEANSESSTMNDERYDSVDDNDESESVPGELEDGSSQLIENEYRDDEGFPDDHLEEEMEGDWLMGVSFDDEENSNQDSEPEKETESANKKSREKDADAIAKEFFTGLKDKVLSVFKRDKAPKDGRKEKPPRKRKESKREKRKKPERKKGKKGAPVENKKKLNLNKIKLPNKGIMIYMGLGILIIAVAAALFFINGNSYKTLTDIERAAELKDKDFDEKIEVDLKDLSVSDDKIHFTIKNKGEMSANFSMSATFKEHSNNPFGGNKIECESDIIYLDPDGEIKESFTCQDSMSNDSKYKLNVSLEKF